jgi:hypothetical protein
MSFNLPEGATESFMLAFVEMDKFLKDMRSKNYSEISDYLLECGIRFLKESIKSMTISVNDEGRSEKNKEWLRDEIRQSQEELKEYCEIKKMKNAINSGGK